MGLGLDIHQIGRESISKLKAFELQQLAGSHADLLYAVLNCQGYLLCPKLSRQRSNAVLKTQTQHVTLLATAGASATTAGASATVFVSTMQQPSHNRQPVAIQYTAQASRALSLSNNL